MAKRLTWITAIVCLSGAFVLAPLAGQGQAQSLSATFFIAHADTHANASLIPIPAVGGRALSFEVRVRDAGSAAKAGWQARIILDACRFEMPSAADVQFGDYMQSGILIPVGPKIKQTGNRILIDQGQVYLSGETAAASGLLATIRVVPKTRVNCPDPATPPPAEVTGDFDLALLAAPGGQKYDVVAIPGRFTYYRSTYLPLVAGSAHTP